MSDAPASDEFLLQHSGLWMTDPELPAAVKRGHRELAAVLVPVALAAGRIQLGYFRQAAAVTTKADQSPVTRADQEAEQLILAELARLTPGVPVVAEEAMAAGLCPETGACFFLVDPLDGTREFIAGRGEFTVNIALVDQGRAVFGLVYAPASGDLFVTVGAHEVVRSTLSADSAAPIAATLASARRVRVRVPDPARLTALVSRSHPSPGTEALLARYPISERRRSGSSLKFCLIAAGEGDIYPRVGRTNEWDTAAGQAVLEAAGGCVVTTDGEPLRYGKAAEAFRNPDYIAWGAPVPLAPTERS